MGCTPGSVTSVAARPVGLTGRRPFSRGTQAVDAPDVTPRWCPTRASRVRPAYRRSADADSAAFHRETLVGQPGDDVDEELALLDLDPLVQALLGVVVLDGHDP